MIYVMSDMHGEYEKYIKMLELINLGENDTLYILGDAVDRGEHGVKIWLDMMGRKNVVPILGNHDFMAYRVLRELCCEITGENVEDTLSIDTLSEFELWMVNGGSPTIKAFKWLSVDTRQALIDYIEGFDLYAEITVNGKEFVLTHAGLGHFREDKLLSDYELWDLIWERADYSKQYFKDRYLVTGHTPTVLISSKYSGRIFKGNNHIAVDCGVAFGKPLGCICLDNFEEFYV